MAAIGRLEQRLKVDGENGAVWQNYLQLTDLADQLRRPTGPDVQRLNSIYGKFAAGQEGLELVWFVEVRQALRQYVELLGVVGRPDLQTAYGQQLDQLADQLEKYAAQPSTEGAVAIGGLLGWLENAQQAPNLVQAVRAELVYPNLYAQVNSDLLAAGIAGPVDRTEPVSDVILGTVIHGTGWTVGQTSVNLIPDANMGVFDAVLTAVNSSQTVGRNGPVCIYSSGRTGISSAKRFWADATGLYAYPAVSNAVTRNTICDIQSIKGRRIVESIAWRKAGQQGGQAEYIASRHAEQRASRQVDQEAAASMEKSNSDYQRKVRQPLLDRLVFPQSLDLTTTPAAIEVVGLQAAHDQLGAPTAPPPLTEVSDMAVRVHETMVNNMAATVLSGMVLREDTFQSTVTDLLGYVPERLKPDEDKEPWTIAFARQEPITISFADGGFTVTLRGREFYKGDRGYPGMNVTAAYKFVKADGTVKAVRQGDLQIFPPGFVPGGGRQLSVRQQVIRNLLLRRFGKIFEPEMVPEGIKPTGKWEVVGKLMPVELTGRDGWLTIGWRRTAVQATATASSQ